MHCSLRPAGFGLSKGLVCSVDERGGNGHRFAGKAPNAQKTECETIHHVRPPSHVFLERILTGAAKPSKTIQFTIDILSRVGWRAESLPVKVTAPMAGDREAHGRAAVCTQSGGSVGGCMSC